MNELLRRSYLQAMGVDTYVSRMQLPGAAPTQRLAIVRSTVAPAKALPEQVPTEEVSPEEVPPEALPRDKRPPATTRKPGIELPKSQAQSGFASSPPAANKPAQPAVRFSIVAMFSGGVAWLEALDGRPLANEQLRLVHAMTRAVHGKAEAPRVAQFDWPMHNNHQLDQGMDSARAALGAFLRRHIEEQHCRALVVLGEIGRRYIGDSQMQGIVMVHTLATLEMLQAPECKRQVWADLQQVVLRA